MAQAAKPNQDKVIAGLEKALANTYTLMIKTHNFHWNVTGSNFVGLHKLFEEQYKDLFNAVDELAERIRALGSPAPGSLADFKRLSSIQDAPEKVQNSSVMIDEILKSRDAMLADDRELLSAAEDADDQVTTDMITGRIGKNEKDMWMLRSIVS